MHLHTIIFFILFFAVTILFHIIVWKTLVKKIFTNINAKHGLQIFLGISILTIGISKIISTFYMYPFANLINLIAMTWFGVIFFTAMSFVFMDIAKFFIKYFLPKKGHSPERRLFLQRSLYSSALVGVTAASSVGVAQGLKKPLLVEVEVPVKNLPEEFENFKIVQITDLHVGPFIKKNYVNYVVDMANDLKPDLMALTGDFVDGQISHLKDDIEPIKKLTSKWGSFFVTGNHEYYSGVNQWIDHFRGIGVNVLRNESKQIIINNKTLNIVGVDDWRAKSYFDDHGPDYPKAFKNCNAENLTVLLSHQPKAFDTAIKYGTDLQLSGHTHGGQIWPFNWAVALTYDYVKGLYKKENSHIYVSSGTGLWGPIMRLGTQAEITLLKLVKEKSV